MFLRMQDGVGGIANLAARRAVSYLGMRKHTFVCLPAIKQSRSSVVGKGVWRTVAHLDGVRGSRASGWIADLDALTGALGVEFFSMAPDGQAILLVRTRANQPHADLGIVRGVPRGRAWAWSPSIEGAVEVFVDGHSRDAAAAARRG
jgi:hypothetical protein